MQRCPPDEGCSSGPEVPVLGPSPHTMRYAKKEGM